MYGSREVQFPARRPFPHAEGQLRMRMYVLRVRRASSACGQTFFACGAGSPHASNRSPRAETHLRMRRCTSRRAETHPRMRRCTSRRAETYPACGDALLGVRRRTPHAEVHFSACGDVPRMQRCISRRAETYLRMRRCTSRRAQTLLRMRRCTSRRAETYSACGGAFLGVRRRTSACGGALLGVRRPCSACGGSVLTCGDIFSKLSQPSRFITPLVLILGSILAWLTS